MTATYSFPMTHPTPVLGAITRGRPRVKITFAREILRINFARPGVALDPVACTSAGGSGAILRRPLGSYPARARPSDTRADHSDTSASHSQTPRGATAS